MFDIKSATERLLQGSIIIADNGTNMYTPDGKANYAALWTRDFAYMLENASDLILQEDMRKGIEYLITHAAENAWIPDRVEKDGTPRYTAGAEDFPALPNLDNGQFLCLAVDAYLKTLDENTAKAQFAEWKDALIKGVDCLPCDQNGFILNETTPPHSPYGFTDTVAKTGALCFETLLLWKAQKVLDSWLQKTGSAPKYEESIKNIEMHFVETFMGKDGMLRASTAQCGQTDIWASCFAVSIGFPLKQAEKKAIANWIKSNYSSVVSYGQLRHLPSGEYWEKTFIEVERGTYQNGAFWATPTGWLIDTLMLCDGDLARKTLSDALWYFENYGIFECVNGEYRNLDTYVASATNVYGVCKKYNII